MKSTVNCMVRDEPFVFYALASVASYADEILVYDTGSTDGTIEDIKDAAKIFNNIKLTERKIDDCQSWSFKGELNTNNISDDSLSALGNIRREMHEKSSGDFTWILDGDEVYDDESARAIKEYFINEDLSKRDALFYTFIDLVKDHETIRLIHTMGRIFRKNAVEIRGNYPTEMHFHKQGNYCIENWSPCSFFAMFPKVFHYESIIKPWRKKHQQVQKIKIYPEVFARYPEKLHRIEKYLPDMVREIREKI